MKKFVLIVPLLFALSGCFDLKQGFSVSSDGTTQSDIRIAVAAAAVSMFGGIRDEICSPSTLVRDAEGLEVTASASEEAGDFVCTVTVKGPTDTVFSTLADASRNQVAGAKSPLTYTYAVDGDVRRFSVALLPGDRAGALPDQFGGPLIGVLAAGRRLSWSLSAPDIVSTNGTLSEDGRTASFSIPLVDIVSGTAQLQSFDVAFRTEKPGFWNWLRSKF